jgi:hypothetical protein
MMILIQLIKAQLVLKNIKAIRLPIWMMLQLFSIWFTELASVRKMKNQF